MNVLIKVGIYHLIVSCLGGALHPKSELDHIQVTPTNEVSTYLSSFHGSGLGQKANGTNYESWIYAGLHYNITVQLVDLWGNLLMYHPLIDIVTTTPLSTLQVVREGDQQKVQFTVEKSGQMSFVIKSSSIKGSQLIFNRSILVLPSPLDTRGLVVEGPKLTDIVAGRSYAISIHGQDTFGNPASQDDMLSLNAWLVHHGDGCIEEMERALYNDGTLVTKQMLTKLGIYDVSFTYKGSKLPTDRKLLVVGPGEFSPESCTLEGSTKAFARRESSFKLSCFDSFNNPRQLRPSDVTLLVLPIRQEHFFAPLDDQARIRISFRDPGFYIVQVLCYSSPIVSGQLFVNVSDPPVNATSSLSSIRFLNTIQVLLGVGVHLLALLAT